MESVVEDGGGLLEDESCFDDDYDDYLYAGSDDDEADCEALSAAEKYVSVDVEATAACVGSTSAYQWQKEWRACRYNGHQDENDRCKFFVNVWQDYMLEVDLDPQHPLKPPKLDICFPKMDSESTLMVRRMELIEPKKWNFCTKLSDILQFVETILRLPGSRQVDMWSPLEEALYDLGELFQVQPKCAPNAHLTLPKFGQESALAAAASQEIKYDDALADTHRKRKLQGVGWTAGIGYGSGPVNQAKLNNSSSSTSSLDAAMTVATAHELKTESTTTSTLTVTEDTTALLAGNTEQPLSADSKSVHLMSQACNTRQVSDSNVNSVQMSKSEVWNASLLRIIRRIHNSVSKKDAHYICERSPWHCGILPFIKGASPFDIEKFEELFELIGAVANIIADETTTEILRRRKEEMEVTGRVSYTTGVAVQDAYQKLLAPEHVLQCSMGVDAHRNHAHHRALSKRIDRSGPPPPQLVKRAMREFQTLLDALPLNEDTAVFARHNSDNLLHFKLLIIPSSETPYAYGCYVFSIILPQDYPHSPPSVDFQTTDGGHVRFNPNLYANGKVCLSLLGTWPGRPEEMWNADTSNLLAVALSIQALILTSEPYWNEPGFESRRGTAAGEEAMKRYNDDVKRNCKRVAIDLAYAEPPAEFASVIRKHLEFHRDNIQSFYGSSLGSSSSTQSQRTMLPSLDNMSQLPAAEGKSVKNDISSLSQISLSSTAAGHQQKISSQSSR